MNRRIIIMLALSMPMFYCVNQAPIPVVMADVSGQPCAICHGVDNTAVLTTGQHNLHCGITLYGGSKCEDCHVDNTVTHSAVDGKVLMTDGKTLSGTTVCDKCHGNGAALAKSYWKSPAGTWLKNGSFCESCHDGSSMVNAKPAKNIMAYYSLSGHGNKSKYRLTQHGQNGPGYACDVCHDPSGPGHFHTQPGDSLLRINNAASGLCLDCHDPKHFDPGELGITAVSKGSRHATSVTHKYDYNYECSVCHDPHGTANLAMVLPAINGKLGAGPVAIIFTDTTMFDPSVIDTNTGAIEPVDGICNACHAAGTLADSAHGKTNHPGNHRQGRACWECHFHSKGFDTLATIASIYVDQTEVALTVGGSTQIVVSSISKSNAESDITGSAKYTIDKPAVVSADSTGNLTGLSAGTAIITFTYAGLRATVSVNVTSSTSVTFSLTTAATFGGSISPATDTYVSGTAVVVTATPATGFVFTGWSGALTGTTNPATITMDANKTVTANFK